MGVIKAISAPFRLAKSERNWNALNPQSGLASF